MTTMAKDVGLKIYFRTTPKLRGVYNRLTGALRATDAISSKKGYTSNDAIINALLLWAAARDPEDLARDLGSYIEHFEGIWDEVLASGPAVPEDEGPPEAPVKKRRGKAAAPASEVELPSPGSSEQGEWVTAGIRQRTDGDNAKIARQNRQTREAMRAKPKEEKGDSESANGEGGRKGKSSP
jgi:hypothetical protein